MSHQRSIEILSFARLKFNRAEEAFKKMFRAAGETSKVINKMITEIETVSKHIKLAESKGKVQKIKSKPSKEEKRNSSLLVKQNEKIRIRQIAEARKKAERNQFINADELRPIEAKRKEKVFETRVIDTSDCTPLRLDKNTVVYIKPGVDPEEVRRKFRERNNEF